MDPVMTREDRLGDFLKRRLEIRKPLLIDPASQSETIDVPMVDARFWGDQYYSVVALLLDDLQIRISAAAHRFLPRAMYEVEAARAGYRYVPTAGWSDIPLEKGSVPVRQIEPMVLPAVEASTLLGKTARLPDAAPGRYVCGGILDFLLLLVLFPGVKPLIADGRMGVIEMGDVAHGPVLNLHGQNGGVWLGLSLAQMEGPGASKFIMFCHTAV